MIPVEQNANFLLVDRRLMLYSLLRTSSKINRLLLQDSCAKELAPVISGLYQENYKKFQAHVLTSDMKPNATSQFSSKFVERLENKNIFSLQSNAVLFQRTGNLATLLQLLFKCEGPTINFSQLLCLLDHGSDVMVRAFVMHLLELDSIPLSTHGNNFKNSVC